MRAGGVGVIILAAAMLGAGACSDPAPSGQVAGQTPAPVATTRPAAASQTRSAGPPSPDELLARRPVNQAVPKEEWPRLEDFLTLVSGQVPEELRQRVEIRGYEFQRTTFENMPVVRLEVFNLHDTDPLTFEIRTLFFREDGVLLDTTEWARASAPARGAYRYRAVCFSPLATTEQVQVRLLTSTPATGG